LGICTRTTHEEATRPATQSPTRSPRTAVETSPRARVRARLAWRRWECRNGRGGSLDLRRAVTPPPAGRRPLAGGAGRARPAERAGGQRPRAGRTPGAAPGDGRPAGRGARPDADRARRARGVG